MAADPSLQSLAQDAAEEFRRRLCRWPRPRLGRSDRLEKWVLLVSDESSTSLKTDETTCVWDNSNPVSRVTLVENPTMCCV